MNRETIGEVGLIARRSVRRTFRQPALIVPVILFPLLLLAINASGLRITGPIAEFTVRAPAFRPDDVRGEWDTILLATKAHHP